MRLLGEAEVVNIIGAYMSSLKETAKDVLDISVEMTSREQRRPEFGTTKSQKQTEALFDLLQDTYAVTCEIRKDVKEVKAGMKLLSQQVEELRGAVLPRLCELVTFAKEGEAGKLPRMFVLTEEVGLVRRVVCRMVPGLHKFCLELPCECRTDRAHLVNGQSGLSITTLDEGLVKSGLPYILGFLKVAYAATKIAAHVAVGCNDLIPDFTEILASIVEAPEFGPSQPFTDMGSSLSRIDLSNGQHWLFKVLSAAIAQRVSRSMNISDSVVSDILIQQQLHGYVTSTAQKVNLARHETNSDSGILCLMMADRPFSSEEAPWCILSLWM
ncbi:hypothetical protein GOP47_0016121 [Adiantum capillus-veneris]|uniref:Uncharacterized protein n=1 Tax=Adiantum capillus-veneris TaxID=13818 RepID=A0A9D4UK93_ADICA|nr:hypothetical protein GOP47_0015764 [Adiantum capillus-veneris]KAI5069820.1 hypothetical protein GOP47_0016121 [Adiantum capillus-veneris]